MTVKTTFADQLVIYRVNDQRLQLHMKDMAGNVLCSADLSMEKAMTFFAEALSWSLLTCDDTFIGDASRLLNVKPEGHA